MKVYIAARAATRLKEVKRIQKRLIAQGHIIAYDWANNDTNIKKPYRDPANRKHNESAQNRMLKTVAKADVLIFLDEPGLRGAYVELGAFLFDGLDSSRKKCVYIVGSQLP